MDKKEEKIETKLIEKETEIPVIEVKPSKELTGILKQGHFYNSTTFYFSVISLIVSIGSIIILFLSSPLSNSMRSKIEYAYYTTNFSSSIGNNTINNGLMLGFIKNDSKYSAEDLIVNVEIFSDKPANITVQFDYEYSIDNTSTSFAKIKFPYFPPKGSCLISVGSILPPISLPKGTVLPYIESVYSRDGYGTIIKNWKP
jgi:hypothetical protein